MGYIIATVDTYCGTAGTAEVSCSRCNSSNSWQKLSSTSYSCTRCKCTLSIAKETQRKLNFIENKQERDEIIG